MKAWEAGAKATRIAELAVEQCGVDPTTITKSQVMEFAWMIARDAEAKELFDAIVAWEASEPRDDEED